MEKLQIAIEQARQRREGKQDAKQSSKQSVKDQGVARSRKRFEPRLLPDGLMELWSTLPEIVLPNTIGDNRRLVSQLTGRYAVTYYVLRTKALTELRKNGWRRVAITSPSSGCGKTTTACNLAFAIARQGELRTSFFDLDLRRPTVARILAASPKNDISEVLDGTVDYAQNAMRVGANLSVATAKGPNAYPVRILAGEQAGVVTDGIEEMYAPDVMIFDLPPILVMDDARAFLRNVHCAIFMAKAGSTSSNQIDICERELSEQTNRLGVVLNECHFDEAASDY